MITVAAIQFWIASFFYILATTYLLYRIKNSNLPLLYPLTVYLGSIATFFIFMGISVIAPGKVVMFVAALALIFGGSSITRFPLRLQFPDKEKLFYIILLAVGSITLLSLFLADLAIPIIMRFAHSFALLTAGVYTMGFIFYTGIKAKDKEAKKKSLSIASAMGLCCIVAHGLIALQLFVSIALPLFGIFTLTLPLIFALFSPLALILALYIGKQAKVSGNAGVALNVTSSVKSIKSKSTLKKSKNRKLKKPSKEDIDISKVTQYLNKQKTKKQNKSKKNG
jgi:hypothetical protein